MRKVVVGLVLVLVLGAPIQAGELDNEAPRQSAPAALVRPVQPVVPADILPGTEMDQESPEQSCFWWRPWGFYGFGPAWGFYRPAFYGGWGGWGGWGPRFYYGWGGWGPRCWW